jgi:hypothetical protein
VGSSGLCHVSGGETEGSHVVNGGLEALKDVIVGDVQDSAGEDLSFVEYFNNLHLVREGSDAQLVQKGAVSQFNLLTFLNDLLVVLNFNLGLHNFSGDVQGLEEGGLFGVETG